MKLKKRNALVALIALSVVFLLGCDKELNTIGAEIVGEGNYETKKATFDVIAFNRKLSSVRTDGLSQHQLGSRVHPVFGRTKANIVSQLQMPGNSTNPTFGLYSASEESEFFDENQDSPETHMVDDEMETVKAVYLHIPFISDQIPDSDRDGANDNIDPEPTVVNADADADGVIDGLDTNDNDGSTDYDGDGLSDSEEVEKGTNPYVQDTDNDGINDNEDNVVNCSVQDFELESIYGNVNENFNVRVSLLTDFIQTLDPNTGFSESTPYFSDDIFEHNPTPLFEGAYEISTQNYVIERNNGSCDNPDTEENESITCETLPAGIRIELTETSIFQDFLDAESSEVLLNNNNLNNFLRGLLVEVEANNLLMTLNAGEAFVNIDYEYNREVDVNECDPAEDPEYVVELSNATYRLDFGGKIINTFEDEDYPDEISFDVENPENLYVKGGSGSYVELNLFDLDGSVLDTIPENWLINEANLVFHVDGEDISTFNDFSNPDRLYLYNLTEESTLIDYNLDFVGNATNVEVLYPIFGGVSEDKDNGTSYKFRITEHISRIIRENSTNAKLGLFTSSDIVNTLNVLSKTSDTEELLIPQATIDNPFGTIIYGANTNVPEKYRLKLEIYYTKP